MTASVSIFYNKMFLNINLPSMHWTCYWLYFRVLLCQFKVKTLSVGQVSISSNLVPWWLQRRHNRPVSAPDNGDSLSEITVSTPCQQFLLGLGWYKMIQTGSKLEVVSKLHVKAITKCDIGRQHFWMHFHKWKHFYVDSNSTEGCIKGWIDDKSAVVLIMANHCLSRWQPFIDCSSVREIALKDMGEIPIYDKVEPNMTCVPDSCNVLYIIHGRFRFCMLLMVGFAWNNHLWNSSL